MSRTEMQRNYAQVMLQLATLYRDPSRIPRNEQREAAKALGLESWLPDEQQVPLRLTA